MKLNNRQRSNTEQDRPTDSEARALRRLGRIAGHLRGVSTQGVSGRADAGTRGTSPTVDVASQSAVTRVGDRSSIVRKQRTPISDELRKAEVDQRKYFEAQRFARRIERLPVAQTYRGLSAALRGFFVKNAPMSYNASRAAARQSSTVEVSDASSGRRRSATVSARASSSSRVRDRVADIERRSLDDSRRLDRSFSRFQGIRGPRENQLPFNYFRTAEDTEHPWADYLSEILAQKIGWDPDQVNKVRTFTSYDLSVVDLPQSASARRARERVMVATYLDRLPILNGSFRGASRADAAYRQLVDRQAQVGELTIGDLVLTVWRNAKDDHSSKATQAGMYPNLVQAFEILAALKLFKNQNVRPPLEASKVFTSEVTEATFERAKRFPVELDYKKALLDDRRALITDLSREIERRLPRGRHAKIVPLVAESARLRGARTMSSRDAGVPPYQYPALVLAVQNQFADTDDWRAIDPKLKKVSQLIAKAMHKFTTRPDGVAPEIGIANRQSFGFVTPTVGELDHSVRIWPGLIPAELFKEIVLKALDEAELFAPDPRARSLSASRTPVSRSPLVDQSRRRDLSTFGSRRQTPSPLEMALLQSMRKAVLRRERLLALKDRDIPDEVQEVNEWVGHRVTSNLIKAQALLDTLARGGNTDLVAVSRAIRTLENLSEYDVLQANLEEAILMGNSRTQIQAVREQSTSAISDERVQQIVESRAQAQRSARERVLLREFESQTRQKFASHPTWNVRSVRVQASGMSAYRSIASAAGAVRDNANRVYFEVAELNSPRERGLRLNRHLVEDPLTTRGLIVQLEDLAYNVSSQSTSTRPGVTSWRSDDPSLPKIAVFDSTNTTAEEALSHAQRDADFVVLFESFSKHFQFGADKTTLGKITIFQRKSRRADVNPDLLRGVAQRLDAIKNTHMPNGYLNYMVMQQAVFGDGQTRQQRRPQIRSRL